MKIIFASAALILGTVLTAPGQVNTRALEELHAGARSFKSGHFEEAQQHFQNRCRSRSYTASCMLVDSIAVQRLLRCFLASQGDLLFRLSVELLHREGLTPKCETLI
jgi:hypothetical protein